MNTFYQLYFVLKRVLLRDIVERNSQGVCTRRLQPWWRYWRQLWKIGGQPITPSLPPDHICPRPSQVSISVNHLLWQNAFRSSYSPTPNVDDMTRTQGDAFSENSNNSNSGCDVDSSADKASESNTEKRRMRSSPDLLHTTEGRLKEERGEERRCGRD